MPPPPMPKYTGELSHSRQRKLTRHFYLSEVPVCNKQTSQQAAEQASFLSCSDNPLVTRLHMGMTLVKLHARPAQVSCAQLSQTHTS